MRADVDKAIDALWRIESAKIVAGAARLVRDIGLAEELAGDALVVFNEAYTATSGNDWMRPALMDDALRLGRAGANRPTQDGR